MADTDDTGGVTYTQAQLDKALDDQRQSQAAMFTTEQVDEMIAELTAKHDAETKRLVEEAKTEGKTATDAALAELKAKHDAAIKKLVDAKPATPKQVKAVSVTPLTIVAGKGSPSSALTAASQVQFVDEDDRPLPGLPAMTFEARDFTPSGSSVTLTRDVDFPKEIASTEVSGAFLIDGGGTPIGKATLVMPFAIGGGRSTRLASSSLQFAG